MSIRDGAAWVYDPDRHTYRDPRTGRYLSPAASALLRDDFIRRRRDRIDAVSRQLEADELTPNEWRLAMRTEIQRAYTVQYAFGRGGVKQMKAQDRRAIGAMVRGQDSYLRTFAEAVEAGTLSVPQIRARAQMYLDSGVQAHAAGQIASYEGLDLPRRPGDGQTECKARCKCYLTFRNDEDAWRVRWIRTARESCDDCIALAREWAPLVIPKA